MPFYDYFCEKNGRTVEVFHSMNRRLNNWGEVCEHAGIDRGKISSQTPVTRLVSRVTPMIFRLKGLDKDAPGPNHLIV